MELTLTVIFGTGLWLEVTPPLSFDFATNLGFITCAMAELYAFCCDATISAARARNCHDIWT